MKITNKLIYSNGLSNFGFFMSSLAITYKVLYELNYDISKISIITMSQLLPFVILGYLTGKLSDKLNSKKLILFSDFLRGAIVIIIWITSNFYVLAIAIFISGFLASLYLNSFFVYIRQVSKDEILKINYSKSKIRIITKFIAPLIFTVLLKFKIWQFAFLIDFLTYLFSFILIKNINVESNLTNNETNKNKVVRAKFNMHVLNPLLLMIPIMMLLSVYSSTGNIMFRDFHHVESKFLPLISVMMSLGMLVGNKLAKNLNSFKSSHLVAIFLLLMSATISYGIFHNNIVIFTSIFIIGIAFGLFTLYREMIIQKYVSKEYLARVRSISSSVEFFFRILLLIIFFFSNEITLILKVYKDAIIIAVVFSIVYYIFKSIVFKVAIIIKDLHNP